MDEARFAEGERAYAAGDYRAAAKSFLAAAGPTVEGSGRAYHCAGNALMRLRRHDDAATVYKHALDDPTYARPGSVSANLGAALAAAGHYGEAVEAYERALADPSYDTPYKAMQGMGGALFEMGRYPEAATAYRGAAVEGSNPDPGKAMNNLGLCFMALGRVEDAAESYKAAIAVEGYEGKGRAAANLGVAYAALGKDKDAASAFERATQLYGHTLSAAAESAFAEVRDRLYAEPASGEVVEGWSTGEIAPAFPEETPAAGTPSAIPEDATADADVTAFFNITDKEMRERDRAARRAERSERREGRNPWAIVAVVGLVLVLIAGALAGAFFAGYGYPTQSQTVDGMLEARKEGKQVDSYWVAVPTGDIDKEMSALPAAFKSFRIDKVERHAQASKVAVTVTLERGAPLHYTVSLAREGVGWKVNGIANDWRSTGGGT